MRREAWITLASGVLLPTAFLVSKRMKTLWDDFLNADIDWEKWRFHDPPPRGEYSVHDSVATFMAGRHSINVYTKKRFSPPLRFGCRVRVNREVLEHEPEPWSDEFYAFMFSSLPSRWHYWEFGFAWQFRDRPDQVAVYTGNIWGQVSWHVVSLGFDAGEGFHDYEVLYRPTLRGPVLDFMVDQRRIITLGAYVPPRDRFSLVIGYTNWTGGVPAGRAEYDWVWVE